MALKSDKGFNPSSLLSFSLNAPKLPSVRPLIDHLSAGEWSSLLSAPYLLLFFTAFCNFKDYYYINAYFPNSQPERARLKYKLGFCEAMTDFCKKAMKKNKEVIVCGDYNVAHTPLDIKNAKSNKTHPVFILKNGSG